MSEEYTLRLFVRNHEEPLHFKISEEDAERFEEALLPADEQTTDFFQFSPHSETVVVLNLSAVHSVKFAPAFDEIPGRRDMNFKHVSYAYVANCSAPVALSAASARLLFDLCWDAPATPVRQVDRWGQPGTIEMDDLICLVIWTE